MQKSLSKNANQGTSFLFGRKIPMYEEVVAWCREHDYEIVETETRWYSNVLRVIITSPEDELAFRLKFMVAR